MAIPTTSHLLRVQIKATRKGCFILYLKRAEKFKSLMPDFLKYSVRLIKIDSYVIFLY